MKRGEIWSVSAGGAYAGKPRPCVIIQDDRFSDLSSVTICLFTSNPTNAPLFRPVIQPNAENGLQAESRIMADKISTVPAQKLGKRIGQLSKSDMVRLERAIMVFLGLG